MSEKEPHGYSYETAVNGNGQYYAVRSDQKPLSEHQFPNNFIPAANHSHGMSYNQLVDRDKQALVIQQIMDEKTVGSWVLVPDSDEFQVWDGEKWLKFPRRLAVELQILPHNATERFFPEGIDYLIEVYAEEQDEEDRMELRRMLEALQTSEDDLEAPTPSTETAEGVE